MKCEKCGYETHPGDQICINCKANLSLAHSFVPGIDKEIEKKDEPITKKKEKPYVLFYVIGVVVFLIVFVSILALCFR